MKAGYRQGSKKEWVDQFDSLPEALQYAKENTNRKSSDKRETGEKWYGSKDLDTAVEMGMSGWHDIRPEVDEMFSKMEEHISVAIGEVFQTKYDFGGDSVDMDRYLQGDPECMIDYVSEPAGRMGRVIRIHVAICASASVSTERIMRRGVLACALVDCLNKLGVGVEVWTEEACSNRGDQKWSTLIKLHSSEERLDINNLMFALAHPSMLRRVGFSILERSKWPSAASMVTNAYGTPCDMLSGTDIEADISIERTQLSIGDSTESGVEFIMSAIKGLDLIK